MNEQQRLDQILGKRVEWCLIGKVERGIYTRLGRSVMLQDLSAITLEQLHYLIKTADGKYLEKALDEALGL